MFRPILAAAVFAIPLLGPVQGLAQGPAQPLPRMLATIGMIADPAQRMAGDCVAVEALIGPGLDPHLYQPRPSDLQRLRQADRVVALGLGLEGRLAQVLARSGALILGEGLDPALLRHDAGEVDPHLWMDPDRWAAILPPLAQALGELAPGCADDIAARLDAESVRFAALADWARASLDSVPAERRVLLTAHDAFGYMDDAFGLETLGLQGMSTESEPSIADIDALARLAADRAIPAVFLETTLSPRAVMALIEAARARGHELRIGGELYSDALGAPGSEADSYPGMIVANVTAIVTALGGTPAPVPEGLLP